MHIHFVCSGNAYRSRLAEAYFKSKIQGREITVSSSGTGAKEHKFGNGPICWYAMRIMKREKLIPFMSWHERQTAKELLEGVDLLICMNKSHLEYCRNISGNADIPFEVWDIQDLNEMDGFIASDTPGIDTDINHIALTEQTFRIIAGKVDNLVNTVVRTLKAK